MMHFAAGLRDDGNSKEEDASEEDEKNADEDEDTKMWASHKTHKKEIVEGLLPHVKVALVGLFNNKVY